jgi:hypothetical protein
MAQTAVSTASRSRFASDRNRSIDAVAPVLALRALAGRLQNAGAKRRKP